MPLKQLSLCTENLLSAQAFVQVTLVTLTTTPHSATVSKLRLYAQ
jgi:hypothetical protein